jgi:hypothetical protein
VTTGEPRRANRSSLELLQRIAMTLTRVHVTDARLLAVARP